MVLSSRYPFATLLQRSSYSSLFLDIVRVWLLELVPSLHAYHLQSLCSLRLYHHGCSLPVIHYDVKPSNVLLDEDMVAHLSDFGISKLLDEDQEYGLEGLVPTKCDVYSYEIMLLETFTWRKPNEFEGDLILKKWVSYSLPDAVMEVVDANLLTSTCNRLKKELDVMASIMKVVLDCCNKSQT
ncbi:hypothetical protein BC332_33163 [Capsicum chinense]|nr:hypothetical protein BC332_33163 [Capsicum chinense]